MRRRQSRQHVPGRCRVPATRHRTAVADRASSGQSRLRRQPEGRLPLGDRATASTSSCCCTATGSTRPSACPTWWRRSSTATADAVFGSRMIERGGALAGRHADVQVRRQPDPHRGSRTPCSARRCPSSTAATGPTRVAALDGIPSSTNTDGFDFDTEIIVQLIECRSRIVEVPIPTYYGDEICRVNGMRYAGDVTKLTWSLAAQQDGIRHRRAGVRVR